jgi:hypothetical protein
MPRRLETDPRLPAVLADQDSVLARGQALGLGLTRGAIQHRVSLGLTQWLLPGVLLFAPGEPNRRQRLIATTLWAGEGSLIDGPCACWWHGITSPSYDASIVNVVVGSHSPARSQSFVRVRRSDAPMKGLGNGIVRYVDRPTALVVTASSLPDRAATALLAEAVQRRQVEPVDLWRAVEVAPRRGRTRVCSALRDLSAGIRSVAEADVRRIVAGSRALPEPLWNCWIRLPCGRVLSPDALWPGSRLVHETNGVRFHAWGTDFESMQERHDAMTAAGLVVLHNAPRRLREAPAAILREIERCHVANHGRGLPAGVEMLARGPFRQDVEA